MSRPGRVAWSEGMALDPHHFQQWDRHHLSLLQSRVRACAPNAWGLTELQLDEGALAGGTVRVVRCRGVTADGLLFDIPDSDPVPPPRAIAAHFPVTADRLTVYLSVPAERPHGSNFLLPHAASQRETRFLVERVAVVDEITGQDEREIDVARPNFALRFAGEPIDGYGLLPIAELARTAAGAYRLDEQFVPPCVRVGASGMLMATARRVLERLVVKSTAVWERTRRLPRGQAPMSAADAVSLALQMVVSAFIPLLRHHQATGDAHPEALYETLVMLAGQLTALPGGGEADARALPAYRHEAPGPCVAALDRAIGALLAEEIEENYTTIPLEASDGDIRVGTIDEGLLGGGTTFYLIGSGIAPGAERTLPDQLRIAAPTVLPQVIRGFLRALPVEWEPRTPTGAPAGPDLHYFRLSTSGDFWDEIRSRQTIGVHVPRHLQGVSVQLIAIKSAA